MTSKPHNTLVFASGNTHKLEEVRKALPARYNVVSLRDMGFMGEIDETGTTLAENARIKARFVYEMFGADCFADDTGLEIEALNGEPGVYSARYAGEHCSFSDNVAKVLENLHGMSHREARFVTVIHLMLGDEEHTFEGEVRGTIIEVPRGNGGFGYDPIFIPEGYSRTFAEMTLEEKNRISHRAIAVGKLAQFLASRL